jgi:DNA-binding response OmpR family regulator
MLTLRPRTAILPPDLSIRAIFVGSDDSDFQHLCNIFRMMSWEISHVPTLRQALRNASLEQATHLLYEHLHGDNREWIKALEAADSLPQMPSFILVSRFGDEQLWAEVLNRGGYDLLLKPYESLEVTRVIRAARQYSLRHAIESGAMAG